MEKIKCIALFLILCVPSMAQAEESKFDLSPFLDKLSVCSVVTHKADILAGGCYAPISWGWGSAVGGALWDVQEKDVAGAMGAFSLRADKVFAWAWKKSNLESRGVKLHFVVPKVELGPTGGWHRSPGWFYGGFLNAKWPF